MPLSSGLSGGAGESEPGPPGPVGPTPDMTVGGVTTGAPGTNADVTVTGTPENPVMNFTIPRGDVGQTGAQGSAGQNATTSANATQTVAGLESPADKTKLDTLFLPQSYDAYSAGTPYNLTATAAALTFGTSQPVVTIAVAGTYRISSRAVINYNGLTVASSRTVTLKVRRTNNTPADLPNSSTDIITGIVTLLTAPLCGGFTPDVIYTATAGDILTVFGSYSGSLIAVGTLPVTQASIHAQRVA